MFEELTTLEKVAARVVHGYRSMNPQLPLEVAEPGPLMVRAVEVAGEDGLTLQQLHQVFSLLGKERFDRGLMTARVSGLIREQTERRPSRAGRPQAQTVFCPAAQPSARHDSARSAHTGPARHRNRASLGAGRLNHSQCRYAPRR